ncbi:hypothetical protein [Xanthobacter sp. VNH20]|uniref:hypothetical protein n=1 Tax=Xanthobacter sp. VNH20 TaxID=3156616 RepID=UPI0032B362E6
MPELKTFPFYVLCGVTQGWWLRIPPFGRFEVVPAKGTVPVWLTGLLEASGPAYLAHLTCPLWAVIELDVDDHAKLDLIKDGTLSERIVRFRSGFVVYRGDRRTALDVFTTMTSGAAASSPLRSLQAKTGVARTGDYGVAIAGDEGFAQAGRYGSAECGAFGVAMAGERGTALAGSHGLAVAGDGGVAKAGNGGVAVRRFGSGGMAEVGDSGVAAAQEAECAVKGGRGSVVVLQVGGQMFVGPEGIGVAIMPVKTVVVSDDALAIHRPPLEPGTLIWLGRNATLIFRERFGGQWRGTRSISTESEDVRAGAVYEYTEHGFRLIPDLTRSYFDSVDELETEYSPPDDSPKPDVETEDFPFFGTQRPWWDEAFSHDSEAFILKEAIGEADLVVLTRAIPDADLKAGRTDGGWWLGAPWGQGDAGLQPGAPCALVRVEGAHEVCQEQGGVVAFRSGTTLYRGTLHGAVAALHALGKAPQWGSRLALAERGETARVPVGFVEVPSPPEMVDETERHPLEKPDVVVLRGDRAIGAQPSLAIARAEGWAICGGEAYAGREGMACAFGHGVARADQRGLAICERGRAVVEKAGIAWSRLVHGDDLGVHGGVTGGQAITNGWEGVAVASRDGGSAATGIKGISVVMAAGVAVCGGGGAAIGAGKGSVQAQGGRLSVVVARHGRVRGDKYALLVARDKHSGQWVCGLVGQDGIAPNVDYVARNGRLEPWLVSKTALQQRRRRWLH